MKLAIASIWFAIVIGVAMAGSCSVTHRSGEFDCEKQSDCPAGRTCTDNLCVVNGTGIDAGPGDGPKDGNGLPDAFVCPTTCTSCIPETMTCKIDCGVSAATCNGPIACPTGWNCDILCTTANSCRSGIDCLGSKSCTVECKGNSSCRNIACGDGPCDVNCSGTNSCRGVACGQSCKCDVACAPAAASCESVTCTSNTCSTFPGCTSQFPGCDTCQ